MNIANIASGFAANWSAGGKTLPARQLIQTELAADRQPAAAKVDMHHVSLNEINALIKSGVDGLLDVLPAIPSSINGDYADDVGDVKVDFIASIEGQIAFNKSRNEDTTFLQQVLNKVKKLDGMALPTRLDLKV